MKIFIDVVLRLLVLLAIDVIFRNVVDIPGDDGLGTGLLAFLSLILASGVIGTADGFLRTYGHVAIVWITTGVLYGVGSIVLSDALSGAVQWSTLADDLESSSAFLAGLVIVPAMLAGVLGAVVRPRPQVGERERGAVGRVSPPGR